MRSAPEAGGEGRLLLGPQEAAVVDEAPHRQGDRSARWAAAAFGAYLAVSWFVLVFVFGSERWFFRDDWFFLAGRDGGSLDGVFAAHGEHASAVPVLAFRVLYNLFGLHFTPFLAVVVTMHLGVVTLVRIVVRGAGVGPWWSTVAAGTLVLFGPGEENIQWAFQIGFVGSVLFGLVHLVLADHDGPFSRRDVLGLAAGLAAVFSSGIGPLMVGAVGLATLLRRGWRVALAHTAPLAALYLTWYVTMDPRGVGDFPRPTIGVTLDWARAGMVGTFEGLGYWMALGGALAVVLAVGLVLWVIPLGFSGFRRRAAPLCLLVVAPIFFAMTAQGRWVFGIGLAESSRYVYIGAVLVVPSLAVAIQTIAARWPVSGPVLGLLLVAGVPGNVSLFGASGFSPDYFAAQRQTILGVAHHPDIDAVPAWVRPLPDPYAGPDLTVGFLREALRAGRVPSPGALDPEIAGVLPLRLGLVHAPEPMFLVEECRVEERPVELDLVAGERIRITTPVRAALRLDDGTFSSPLRFSPEDGLGALEVIPENLSVRLTPVPSRGSFEWCR